jgi:hypothetical protein
MIQQINRVIYGTDLLIGVAALALGCTSLDGGRGQEKSEKWSRNLQMWFIIGRTQLLSE